MRSLHCTWAILSLATATLAAHGQADAVPPIENLDLSRVQNRAASTEASPLRSGPYNADIVEVIRTMPAGGGYASTTRATTALGEAIRLDPAGGLILRPELARPVFCSGATYLAFLAVIDRLQRRGNIHLSSDVIDSLVMRRQPDGTGIWGRWNANGPGTARLFHEIKIGRNFTDFSEAEPGDFLKIWWTDEVGSRERGHSVVYLRSFQDEKNEKMVEFWSANSPDGFGRKAVPRAKIQRALFSRLIDPQALERAPQVAGRDAYLADMLRRPSSEEELTRFTGLPPNETGRSKPGGESPGAAASAVTPTPTSGPRRVVSAPRSTPLPATPTPVPKRGFFGGIRPTPPPVATPTPAPRRR